MNNSRENEDEDIEDIPLRDIDHMEVNRQLIQPLSPKATILPL